jgi:hypothetical protein
MGMLDKIPDILKNLKFLIGIFLVLILLTNSFATIDGPNEVSNGFGIFFSAVSLVLLYTDSIMS